MNEMEITMPIQSFHRVGLEEVQRKWGWCLAVGITLVILGTIAIGRSCMVAVVSMFFFGYLMIIGGLLVTIFTFNKKHVWSGFFIDLFTGILYFAGGVMIVANPGATAGALALLIAMIFILVGIFRIVTAVSIRYPSWGWVLLHGFVNVLLGTMIWQQWPLSGLWVIGMFVGVEMILNGWSLVMLSLTAKNLPAKDEALP